MQEEEVENTEKTSYADGTLYDISSKMRWGGRKVQVCHLVFEIWWVDHEVSEKEDFQVCKWGEENKCSMRGQVSKRKMGFCGGLESLTVQNLALFWLTDSYYINFVNHLTSYRNLMSYNNTDLLSYISLCQECGHK